MNFRQYIYDNHWTLGFIEAPVEDVVLGMPYPVYWMDNPYKDRWFADPFILDATESEIVVLVEEFYDPIRRGRISKLIIDRHSYSLKEIIPILELSTHLSFPAIRRVGGGIYIYPENGNASTLKLYTYDSCTDKCREMAILSKEALADAILTDFWGEEMLFSTRQPTHNGSKLSVFRKESGLFKESEVVSFQSNVARNAGDWFMIGDKVYRPAQDCNKRYGGAIIIQEVSKTGDGFIFKDVRRIEHIYKSYKLGCHTFNSFKGLSVVDINGYRRPFLASVMLRISCIKHKLLTKV